MQYDIFISYRREGGDMLAHILYERLTQKGYSVFQDIEVLRSGKFNTAIYERIEQCKVMILILPSNALDRCLDEEDWVRKEIICAIENKKMIIPIMLRGFSWPSEMPEEIREIKTYNGLVADGENFEYFFEKLIEFLITSNVFKEKKYVRQKHIIKSITTGIIVLLMLLFPVVVIYIFRQPFGLLWRIIYFILLIIIAKIAIYEIQTRPTIAAACYGTLTEADLKESPDVVYSRIIGAFGKDIFISKEETEQFTCLYRLKRLSFGTWDNKRTNYLKILFRRKLEWYDPSVFYLHASSKNSEAVKILIRQGFLLQSLPNFMDENVDYLIKDNFHVFLFYKGRKLDYAIVYQCSENELLEKYRMIGIGEKDEKIDK